MVCSNWFWHIYRLDAGEIYPDFQACCLLDILVSESTDGEVNTSINVLEKLMRSSRSQIQSSLDLLKQQDLLALTYPSNPSQLLAGELNIKLNLDKLQKITTGQFPTTTDSSTRGFVYVVRSGHLFKIGRTNNLQRRLRQLSTMNSKQVELICSISTGDSATLEKKLHQQFKLFRQHGEWFDLPADSIQWLKSLAQRI
ncbi:GIY-YIG nuclease family protein [Laspinema olomoucense]|uniref:GIY-YIG nuclease family protein n=1 Tax=Laspinema olomoucense D3b TaxID=2953688 RepID=A0ABT2N6W5_9CYAN|nr:GIY-YIG nuclease family protein [Laspinema sp. D3b]MCT7977579.1 GIY-YIG nuclease family protein [Laspinema sp. D3b]